MVAMVVPAMAHANDGQVWLTANAAGQIVGPVRLSVETDERFGAGDSDDLYESENIAMLGYRFDHVTASAGYVYDVVYKNGGRQIEQRARQDVSFDRLAKIGPIALSGRMRLEERWRDGISGTGVRTRPFLHASMPLVHGVSLIASEEMFFNLGEGAGQRLGYDRSRAFAGIGLPVLKHAALELGYLNQWTRGSGVVSAASATLVVRW